MQIVPAAFSAGDQCCGWKVAVALSHGAHDEAWRARRHLEADAG